MATNTSPVEKFVFCCCGFKGATCCTILSVWAVLMLLCMGAAMRLQAVAMYEDLKFEEAHKPNVSEQNAVKAYNNASTSCFVAAGLYLLYLIFSAIMIFVNFSRSKAIKRAKAY